MDISKSLAQPSAIAIGSATNGTATATATKSSQSAACIYIAALKITANAAPAAAVEASLTGPSSTDLFEIPAAAFAPIYINFGTHPLKCAANTDAVLTLPTLGSGVKGTVTIYYYYGPV